MNTRFIVTVTFLLALLGAGAKPTVFLQHADRANMNAWVDSVYAKMNTEQKVGQLIAEVVDPRNLEAAKQEVKRLITNYHVGCFYFSKGTVANHLELVNYAQSISDVPVMIGLDGEWGLSMRMPDTPRFPRNMMLGAIQDDRLLYEYGLEVARECKAVGVNINFSPAVDVNSNPKNPVIGTRSFGEDPNNVGRKAVAYARGLEDGGVLSVAKHFPGHGNTNEDSHKTLPTVSSSFAELTATDFVPFRNYIQAGLSGVMVAHLNIPALHTGNKPSSMSDRVVDELLKNKMGFDGLVFTDALTMQGARKVSQPNGLMAFEAGAEVLLEPSTTKSNVDAMVARYEKDSKFAEKVDRTCKKILSYKYAMGLNNYVAEPVDGLLKRINTREAERVMRRLYAASMTVLKNQDDVLPVKGLDKRISVVTLGTSSSKNAFTETCKLYTDVDVYALTEANMTSTLEKLKGSSKVIVGIYDDNAAAENGLNKLVLAMGEENVIPVFFVKPYDLSGFSGPISLCNTAVVAYENHDFAQEYAAQVVFGGCDATGRMPVSVEGVSFCGDGIDLRASRLGYGMAEEVGLDSLFLHQVDSLANLGVRKGAFPGCQVLVARHNKIVVNKSYGYTDKTKTDKINGNTLYDLASVSKATGTLSGIMKAVDDGLIRIDGTLGTYTKSLAGTEKGKFLIRDLLYHETGMPAALNIYEEMTDTASYTGALVSAKKSAAYKYSAGGAYINSTAKVRRDVTSPVKTKEFDYRIGKRLYVGRKTYDTIMNIIHNIPLRDNRRYLYSCLNFCLLMEAEENVTKVRHDKYVYDNIFHRLGAYRTVYRPLDFYKKSEIAPTEYDGYFREEVVQGSVHDETAAFSGGIQGNAGLFSNANDLAKLCQMWLNHGMYGGEQILSSNVVDTFTTSKSPNSHRGLGYDKPNLKKPEWSSTCEEAGPTVFGHTGFTGTCFWVDPENDMIYIFLCNRVYPSRNNKAFTEVGARAGIMKALYQAVERNK